MGQKVNPHGLRVGVIKDWDSNWYAEDNFSDFLVEDYKIREFVKKKLYSAGISKIEIERPTDKVRVIIHTAKPGFVIGKGGEEIEWFYTKDWTKVPGSSGIKGAAAAALTEKNKEISEAALKADEFIQGTEGKGTSYHHALFGEEWFLIGRVRGENGERVPAAYKEGYYEEAQAAIAASGGVLDQRRVTENARVVIALTAIGKDASAIGGQNLLLSLADMQRVINQGLKSILIV